MAKFIFITGGVISSLGKGLTSGAIGMILKTRGLNVRLQKFDPYINVDPGTMSPYQHGEVYVTEDGAETDLDLGHYERYTGIEMSKDSNYTTGQIYNSVISKEREGKYLGKTVQVVPHITDEIKASIRKLATDDVDVVISEIGGTVGDIESLPFMEAIRQFRYDVPDNDVLYIHLTLVPYVKAAGEIKTKPTQHSVGKLREIGIQPDILICRTEVPIMEEERAKIALFCNVKKEAVIEEKDVDFSVYELPIIFHKLGLGQTIIDNLKLKVKKGDFSNWEKILKILKNPKKEVEIAVVGKYITHQDAYKSIYEALTHAGIANNARVKVRRVEADSLKKKGAAKILKGVDGVLVPGGFGGRGIEGKIEAIKWAREKKVPFFGICLGMQCAVIEFARNVMGWKDAESTEFNKKTAHPVISLLEEQKKITQMGGSMRLGAYPCKMLKNSLAHKAYGKDKVTERHRHRYEFNSDFRKDFEEHGMVFSGLSPSGQLVEIVELSPNKMGHPWFVAGQFHPEFKSQPVAAHPLFRDFVGAALKHKKADSKKR